MNIPNYLKQIAVAIKAGKCYHVFKGPNYITSCGSERVKECYEIGGYKVVYLFNHL